MWKLILGGAGLLVLPIFVFFIEWTSSSSPTAGGGWGSMPAYAVFSFPMFWCVCLVVGFIGLGIGAMIDMTPAVPTKQVEPTKK